MKKSTLFLLGTVAATSLTAQVPTEQIWSKTPASVVSYQTVEELKAPVLLTEAGESYVTGLYVGDFAFGNGYFGSAGTSSFVKKYSETGEELWAVALQGASTITNITAAADGGFYIAGQFAAEVTFLDVTGEMTSTVIKGMKPTGSVDYFTEQVSAFIAKYDENGVLVNVETFIAAPNSKMAAENMYVQQQGDVQFKISNVKEHNGKVYLSGILKGELQVGAQKVTTPGQDMGGFVMFHSSGAAILSTDGSFGNQSIVSSMTNVNPASASNTSIADVNFTFAGDKLVGIYASEGINTLDVAGQKTEFDYPVENYIPTRGYNLFSLDINTNEIFLKEYTCVKEYTQFQTAGFVANEDRLFLAGQFMGVNPFDQTISATANTDLFLTSFNVNDLTANWSAVSAITESSDNKIYEQITDFEISGNSAILSGATYYTSGDALTSAVDMYVDLSNGTATIATSENYVGGLSVASGKLLQTAATVDQSVAEKPLTQTYTLSHVTGDTSVEDLVGDSGVTVYPTQTSDIVNISTEADVALYDLTGSMVLNATNAKSINIAHLSVGNYLLKVTTPNGTEVVKIVKK